MIVNNTFKQFLTFILIGILLLIVDFGTYSLLYSLNVSLDVSKGLAYILGTITSFYLNKTITFKKKYKNKFLTKFIFLNIISFIFNILINSGCFQLTNHFLISYTIALLASLTINFSGQKLWVFR